MNQLSQMIHNWPFLAMTFLLLALAGTAMGQFDVPWYTVDGGGASFFTGGSLRLCGTIGQSDTGQMSGRDFVLSGGFWPGGNSAIPSSVPDDPIGQDTSDETGFPQVLRVRAGLLNPFRNETGIRLEMPLALYVNVRVFDLSGRLVRQVFDGDLTPGIHTLSWNGKNAQGQRVASGVYLLNVRTGSLITKASVVLLR